MLLMGCGGHLAIVPLHLHGYKFCKFASFDKDVES